MYAALWVKSNFSFLEGASHPDELVEAAQTLGLAALAITDRDGVYGTVRAHMAAKERGLKVLFGAQVTIKPEPDHAPCEVVVLAQNRRGYGALCQLLSRGRQRCRKGHSEVTLSEVGEHSADVIVLCLSAPPIAELIKYSRHNVYALVTRHLRAEERPNEMLLRDAAEKYAVPLVAGAEILYHTQARRPLHDIQTCIRHGVTIHNAGERIRANAEHYLKTPHAMAQLFQDAPRWLERTLEVAERCTFTLSELRYRYPLEALPDGTLQEGRPEARLRVLTMGGAQERYGAVVPARAVAQIDKELALISELDYGGYFLTMWEIVQFCRRENILCQGRGSAANSVVCFCLGITAIDPVHMDLLFERFLSRERAEPPDIDLDIEHNRREEVIQWVYQRYGRRHAAMVANVIRYRARSAVREVGKALGLPLTALDRLAKVLSHHAHEDLDDAALAAAGFDPASPVHQHLASLTREIVDFPRHLSIHPGGFLLGHEPVDTLVPIEPASMADRTVIQWDKQDIEDLGLFKVDLLGLGALTQVHGCLDLIAKHEGRALTLATVPQEDPATYAMVTRGDTVGLFQIESRAQMAMLPRLRPKTFYDLVVQVAIVRPGPIQGDMVHPYLRNRHSGVPPTYPHPSFETVLKKTFGVPIFQEQVMKLAMLAADYTPGEADQLRRDMAAWRSAGRIERHRERLITRMVSHGVPEEFAVRIFEQIRGFGEYGFPESHAASFALIAYVTAWLKCHYPAAFTCALLNAQPMGFYSPATIVEDAKRHAIAMLPIDVSRSAWDCTLERVGKAWGVRMGLRYVQGMGSIEQARFRHAPAPYASMEDFVRRTRLAKKHTLALAEAGAFDSLGLSRREALWAVHGLHLCRQDTLPLMPRQPKPDAQPHFAPLAAGEAVLWDFRQSAHSTRGHPMTSLRPALQRQRIPDAWNLNQQKSGRKSAYVGIVICRQQPQTASGVTFFTLEDETGLVNLVVWRQVFERYAIIAKTAVLLGVEGTIQSEDGVVHLVARRLFAPETMVAPAGVSARDFR